jgi:thiamine transport system substrate-binding protein
MYVFPVNRNAKLDETFIKYLEIPDSPASLDPAIIAANREKWIIEWTDVVLR